MNKRAHYEGANHSCLCLSLHDKTKTAGTKIVKLGAQIVHRDTSSSITVGQRSGFGLGDRVVGVSYAPRLSAPLFLSA